MNIFIIKLEKLFPVFITLHHISDVLKCYIIHVNISYVNSELYNNKIMYKSIYHVDDILRDFWSYVMKHHVNPCNIYVSMKNISNCAKKGNFHHLIMICWETAALIVGKQPTLKWYEPEKLWRHPRCCDLRPYQEYIFWKRQH